MPRPRRLGQVARCDLAYTGALDKAIKVLGKRACEDADNVGEARRDLSRILRDVETCYKEIRPRAPVAPTTTQPTVSQPPPPWWFPGAIEF